MSENSAISWTDHTFNVAWGCIKSTAGCDNCYAARDAKRYGFDVWGPGAARRTFGEKHWAEPLKWERRCAKRGVRERVFCSSMTDLFLNDHTIDAEREKVWPLIRATPHLDWLLLTKHPERIAANLPADWGSGYPNVVLMVTVEHNATRWRIPMLQRIPVAARGLSCEPLVDELHLKGYLDGIGWVIVGGESGHGARTMELDWAREVVSDARVAGAAVFVKQLGAQWASTARVFARHAATRGLMIEREGQLVQPEPSMIDPKGGNMAFWPPDLRVREFPTIGAAA